MGAMFGNYPIVDFEYDRASRTATWTLGRAISNDRLSIDLNPVGVTSGGGQLDGEWRPAGDVFPSGDDDAGGAFRFSFGVLHGVENRRGVDPAAGVIGLR